jgi:hypothetical protein
MLDDIFLYYFRFFQHFFRMLNIFLRNVCFVNYFWSTFCKMLKQFFRNVGTTISSFFKPQPAARGMRGRRPAGPTGAVHGAAGGRVRPAGGQRNHAQLGRGTGGRGVGSGAEERAPAGWWRAGGGHGGTEEAVRETATTREVQPAARGWGGCDREGADQRRRGHAARSRVAAAGGRQWRERERRTGVNLG